MTRFKSLIAFAVVTLAPIAALASATVIIDDFDDTASVVPEPTSALLMVAGFAAVVAVRRMRK